MALIGIDLATSNSLVAHWTDQGVKLIEDALGEFLTPSIVSIADNGDAIVGRPALDRLITHPDRTVASFKRWMGTNHEVKLAKKAWRAEELSALVLRSLKRDAEAGHLAPVERAMGLMAGYGVQLWPVLQDIHQLRAAYGHRAGTFLSNAGVVQVFGVNDHHSARLISDLLGQETVVFQTMARALDSDKTGISYSQQHTGRPLLTPDEVRNLPPNGQLLLPAGQRPIFAEKLAYFADPEFREMFDAV